MVLQTLTFLMDEANAKQILYSHTKRDLQSRCGTFGNKPCAKCAYHETSLHQNPKYFPTVVELIPTIPSITLPMNIDTMLPLRDMVRELPIQYQTIIGDIYFPKDEGKALAQAIEMGQATMYLDRIMDKGCGAHAYTLRTEDNNKSLALSGAALTWGDPDTISSLQREHFRVLAGLLWTWLLMTKHGVKKGTIAGAVDNITVVNQINNGIDEDSTTKHI